MVGLKLDFTPAQPSRLRHVSGPRSPASPLESPTKRLRFTPSSLDSDTSSDSGSSTRSSDPPPSPYKWMWYCHHCRTGYEVGVTRRCLIDDHQLCYGQPIKKRSKKNKKVRSCQSEFDYAGWQNWGAWKRAQTGSNPSALAQPERNCFGNCDWPSQCRWAPKQEQPIEQTVTAAIPQGQEASPPTSSATTVTEPKANDNVLAKISTVTQKLATHWATMLSPVEEEPSSGTIEDFLKLANTETDTTPMDIDTDDDASFYDVPSVAPLGITKVTGSAQSAETISTAPTKIKAFGLDLNFDFDFGFHRTMDENAAPSLAEGLHDMAASTVGIALSVPLRPTAEHTSSKLGRRCVSEPPTLSVRQQEDLQGTGRRMSAASI